MNSLPCSDMDHNTPPLLHHPGTLDSVTSQQRRQILRLLGTADNADMKGTLDVVWKLFGPRMSGEMIACSCM